MITIPVVIFSVLIQPIFNHSGVTPLFYINDNMVCLENIIYGAVISLLLIAVIQWCSVAASYLSSEKMMFYSFCWHDIFYDIKNDTAYEKEIQTNT